MSGDLGRAGFVGHAHHCPYCGRSNDSATFVGTTSVDLRKDGDLSVCWGCRRIGIFRVTAYGVSVAEITPEEEAVLREQPEIKRALGAMMLRQTPAEAAAEALGRLS